MKRRDLARYAADLGWKDPPEPQGPGPSGPPAAAPASPAAAETLEELAPLVEGRTLCGLSSRRQNVVFGEGDPHARLVFVGEGPGADEDRTGRPFVGQAGRLLDAMIQALGLARSQVYIANVVKCRPPGNRNPQEAEMDACAPFLERQLELIRPEIIVALGKVAANRLTGTAKPMKALRGRWASYRGIPLLATYHPAYLLRTPRDKRLVWEDLKLVKRRLEGRE